MAVTLGMRTKRGSPLKRIARWIGGILLILVGLVLSVPGIPGPGILVMLAGVLVLLPESPWLRKKYVRLKRRYPRVFGPLERQRRKLKKTVIRRRAA
jgi:hypothetical protein